MLRLRTEVNSCANFVSKRTAIPSRTIGKAPGWWQKAVISKTLRGQAQTIDPTTRLDELTANGVAPKPVAEFNYHRPRSSTPVVASSVTNPNKAPLSPNSPRAITLPAFATGKSKMANNRHESTTGSFQPPRSVQRLVRIRVRSSRPQYRMWNRLSAYSLVSSVRSFALHIHLSLSSGRPLLSDLG
jgi:hypothetical protein